MIWLFEGAGKTTVQERLSAYSRILECAQLAEPVRRSRLAFEGEPGRRIRLPVLASCKRRCLVRCTFAYETFLMAGGWLVFGDAQCLWLAAGVLPIDADRKRSAGAAASAASLDL